MRGRIKILDLSPDIRRIIRERLTTSLNDEGAQTKKHEWKKLKFFKRTNVVTDERCNPRAFCLLHCIKISVTGVEQ